VSIRKRSTKTRVVYDVRLRTPAGRQYEKTFHTKKEALEYEAEQLSARARGTWIDPQRSAGTTVRQWATTWRDLTRHKAPTSRETDRTVLDRHLLPRFGDVAIGNVSPLDIQALVADWRDKYAASTVRRYYGVTRAMFNAAVQADVIGRSPCRGVKLPEVEETDHVILEPEQLYRLASELPSKYRPMAYVGAVLGLRFEEVAGLRVSSIDFLGRTVSVTETVTTAAGKIYVGPPKTKAARRTLACPGELIDLLAEHMSAIALTGADRDAFLFPDSKGGPLRYSNFLRRVWTPARERAGIPDVGFHDLRRTAITAMVAAGVDVRTAQARAGHSDPRMTLSIYAKATTEGDRAAASAIGTHFLGKRAPGSTGAKPGERNEAAAGDSNR
jgi:integrase